MVTDRVLELIKILKRTDDYVDSDVLSLKLGISTRTLRNDLKMHKKLFENNGFHVLNRRNRGYIIDVFDEEAFANFLELQLLRVSQDETIVPSYPNNRITYIIQQLLVSKTPVSLDHLAEKLYISISTIQRDMKVVEERLRFFNLNLETIHGQGVQIKGSEFHKRSAIAMFYLGITKQEPEFGEKNSEEKLVYDILYTTLRENNFKLTDLGFENLITHIVIALFRIKYQKNPNDRLSNHETLDEKSIHVANTISDKLEEAFGVVFDELERYFITIHLAGKQASQYIEDNVIYADETQALFDKIYKELDLIFGFDFSTDLELYTALALHFQPMKHRLKFGMRLENPILNDIKSENSKAFEISIAVAKIIQEAWGYTLSESEIGYIALHFALALERNATADKKNILVVCSSGSGSSQILAFRIKQKFKSSIENVDVSEYYNLNNIAIENYDAIITTVPIVETMRVPVIYVKYFLSDSDIKNIEELFTVNHGTVDAIDLYYKESLFFKLNQENKESIIKVMCKNIRKVIALPNDFERLVLEREQFASTEYGNSIAIPHPLKSTNAETFVSVAVLEKAILWDQKMVKYVFLINLNKESSDKIEIFQEALSSLVLNPSAIIEFSKDLTVDNLKRILKDLTQEVESLDDIFS